MIAIRHADLSAEGLRAAEHHEPLLHALGALRDLRGLGRRAEPEDQPTPGGVRCAERHALGRMRSVDGFSSLHTDHCHYSVWLRCLLFFAQHSQVGEQLTLAYVSPDWPGPTDRPRGDGDAWRRARCGLRVSSRP